MIKIKIYQCTPYYNEQTIANINLEETLGWVDEFHITEGNMSFQGNERNYTFKNENKFKHLVYHKLDCRKKYISNNIFGKFRLIANRLSKNEYIKRIKSSPTWYNESVQRNESAKWINPNDEDIVILSDIDEIIDSRYMKKIISEVRKRKIITIKLYFTLFYFNLYSTNWGGPKDYSYRVFIMTGEYFKNMKYTSDELRKLGEQGKLINSIYCMDEICGFHHSWLGDEKFILNKINSYAHTEHSKYADIDYIKDCIRNKKSIFPNQNLTVDNNVNLLKVVNDKKKTILKDYFI